MLVSRHRKLRKSHRVLPESLGQMARILIADDNENLRYAVSRALSEREGWAICGQAVDGLSAVSMASALKPDLIIMDFAMPGLNGIAASAEIAKILPSIPIVLYTMHKSRQIEREAEKAGIRRVVSKSDRFQMLIDELEKFLNEEDRPLGPLAIDVHAASVPSSDNSVAKPLVEVPQKADATSLN
jgi:DNA-binding NarL/FixJ family response regulator